MAMKEMNTEEGMTMQEGRIGGKRVETIIIKGKMIEELVEEVNGIESTIMAQEDKIRGGKEIGESRPSMKEGIVKGGDLIFSNEKHPNAKAATPGRGRTRETNWRGE